MSYGSGSNVDVVVVEEVFKATIDEDSIEPPMEEWSSLFNIAEDIDEQTDRGDSFDAGSGEICAKYIALSDSDVFAHVYYNYPCILDPGIVDALWKPEPLKKYNPDGQDLYLDLCKTMNMCPVRLFHRGLIEEAIDLRYYCVNPVGVRAMCSALQLNPTVRRLDLGFGKLSEDACYHLGQLLGDNMVLQELVLCGCKIGPEGVRRLVMRISNRQMEILDLSKNDLEDQGVIYLSEQMTRGAVIKRLNLSDNGLGLEGALALGEALSVNNSVTHLDLSWNKLFKGSASILGSLSESEVLVELNLAWNSLTVAQPFRRLLIVPTLLTLDLSNNRLTTPGVNALCVGLGKAKKLTTLNLANNPLTPNDAVNLVETLKKKTVKLKNLFLDNVVVNKLFYATLQEVRELSYRKNLTITYGKIIHNYTLGVPDMRQIVMRRLFYLTNSPKSCTMDLAVYFLTELKKRDTITPKEFYIAMKQSKAVPEEDLIDEFSKLFPGPPGDKGARTISLPKVAEFVKRLWPDKRPLPTPPPEPEPLPPAKGDKKKKR